MVSKSCCNTYAHRIGSRLARDGKMSQHLAPLADEWPQNSPILDLGLACLTTHWSISTLLYQYSSILTKKGVYSSYTLWP